MKHYKQQPFNEAEKNKSSNPKARTKYVPLFSNDGGIREVIVLPGRHICMCQAAKHSLVNNCVQCGRIVCQQEGSGPCFTCGNLVCSKEEQEVISRGSKTSAKLLQKLLGENSAKFHSTNTDKGNMYGLKAAVEQKNKLLDYDKTVEKRTRVIDDESDYFEVDNKWMSKAQREDLQKKRDKIIAEQEESRRTQKLSFDFAGRQILEHKSNIEYDMNELLNDDISIFQRDDVSSDDIILPNFNPVYEQQDEEIVNIKCSRSTFDSSVGEKQNRKIRIQNRELQEMSDEGMCLSLHQPYASLLVAGIKKHEGRVWYTCYRGRLWIQSAAKIPTKQEIMEGEEPYRYIIGDDCIFPESYPPGCLLGCVDLVDCLPQEEYRAKFPNGESASPYVFICENPQELMIKFPMKGKHKICKKVLPYPKDGDNLEAILAYCLGFSYNVQTLNTRIFPAGFSS